MCKLSHWNRSSFCLILNIFLNHLRYESMEEELLGRRLTEDEQESGDFADLVDWLLRCFPSCVLLLSFSLICCTRPTNSSLTLWLRADEISKYLHSYLLHTSLASVVVVVSGLVGLFFFKLSYLIFFLFSKYLFLI